MFKRVVWALVLAVLVPLAATDVAASGSVGPGMGPLAARGAYTLGKSLLYRQLVCRKCPIPRRGFNRQRARDLKAALDIAFFDDRPRDSNTQADTRFNALAGSTPEETVANVAAVRAYLSRRFKL